MTTSTHSAAATAPLARAFIAFGAAWRALGAIGRNLDEWSQARSRAAIDRDALANMSDRELRDIGLHRSCVNAATDRSWIRDYPY